MSTYRDEFTNVEITRINEILAMVNDDDCESLSIEDSMLYSRWVSFQDRQSEIFEAEKAARENLVQKRLESSIAEHETAMDTLETLAKAAREKLRQVMENGQA